LFLIQINSKGWIGSAAFGLECIFFLPCAICIDLFGSRRVAIFGACLQTFGLLMSVFVKDLPIYFITHSVLFGIGQAFIAESTLQILPHYFNKRLGLANGLMNFGGSIIAIGFLITTAESLESLGLNLTFLIFAGISFFTIVAATLFKSVLKSQSSANQSLKKKLKNSLGTRVLKRPEFIIWWTSACLALVGFSITNVTIV
jgi:MCP family monocarboxylic acid transporter-like MFS transporter 2